MVNWNVFIRKWGLSIVVMLVIFTFSSIPSDKMPYFSWGDFIVKKGGHMLGYSLLALSYWYGLNWDKKRCWLPWLLTILFAVTDEFHQSFVPGRNPSALDVGIDATGSGLILLFLYFLLRRRDRSKFFET